MILWALLAAACACSASLVLARWTSPISLKVSWVLIVVEYGLILDREIAGFCNLLLLLVASIS